MQIPVGIASDKFDRRKVLIGITCFELLGDGLFTLAGTVHPVVILVFAALFGATVFSMYSVIVAYANDHAKPGTYIQVSGGLLLVFGLGSIAGPSIAGFAMTSYGACVNA